MFWHIRILNQEGVRYQISDMGTTPSNRRSVDVTNINYDEILGPWEIRGDKDIGIIGASIPKNFIVNTSAVTRVQIFGLSFLAVIFVIAIGFFLANQITKPLINLVSATNEVAGRQSRNSSEKQLQMTK